ncbi:hypothetical protein [Kiloniella spongiae]|uniref:hypothetical protein n=1 Tax=Kiloniella spongiae TaxID=1489064 RepID=UPI0012E0039A|nr:hypothetical protein [Kiloniella spongiae]
MTLIQKPLDIISARKIAKAFRVSFMETDLSDAVGSLPHFPEGCCNWSSYIIGHYLKYKKGLNPREIIGERFYPDDSLEHSWLLVDDIIIDITSDQFPDSNAATLVSYSSSWHDKWKIVADYPIYKIHTKDIENNTTKMNASQAYEEIIKHLRYLT